MVKQGSATISAVAFVRAGAGIDHGMKCPVYTPLSGHVRPLISHTLPIQSGASAGVIVFTRAIHCETPKAEETLTYHFEVSNVR